MWTVPDFLDALKSQLDARAGLAALPAPAVKVFTHWPTADYSITDALILGHTTRDVQEPESLGRRRFDEVVTIDCQLRVMRAGAGEVKAKEARDRAKAILDELDDELRDSPPDAPAISDQTIKARLATREMRQFPDPGGSTPPVPLRVCLIDFEILYTARTS